MKQKNIMYFEFVLISKNQKFDKYRESAGWVQGNSLLEKKDRVTMNYVNGVGSTINPYISEIVTRNNWFHLLFFMWEHTQTIS